MEISRDISCGCKTGCKAACTCVKNDMECTAVCKCYHADEECCNKTDEGCESEGHDSPYLNYGSKLFWNCPIFFDGSSGSVSVSDMKGYRISHQNWQVYWQVYCKCIVIYLSI